MEGNLTSQWMVASGFQPLPTAISSTTRPSGCLKVLQCGRHEDIWCGFTRGQLTQRCDILHLSLSARKLSRLNLVALLVTVIWTAPVDGTQHVLCRKLFFHGC